MSFPCDKRHWFLKDFSPPSPASSRIWLYESFLLDPKSSTSLSKPGDVFSAVVKRERELYPCKRLGSLTVTRSHSISLFLSVPICKLGIIASTFHGAARIKWVHSRTAVAYGRHRASPYDVNYCHHYWPLPLHWNILKPLPSFKNKNEKTKTLPWRRFHLSLFSF